MVAGARRGEDVAEGADVVGVAVRRHDVGDGHPQCPGEGEEVVGVVRGVDEQRLGRGPVPGPVAGPVPGTVAGPPGVTGDDEVAVVVHVTDGGLHHRDGARRAVGPGAADRGRHALGLPGVDNVVNSGTSSTVTGPAPPAGASVRSVRCAVSELSMAATLRAGRRAEQGSPDPRGRRATAAAPARGGRRGPCEHICESGRP